MSTTNKTYLDLNGLTQYDEKIKEYIEYTEITYEDWLELTDEEKETGKWYVTGVPGADGTVSIDLMTKLWENPSPTSSFAAQNIQLSSSDYDLLLVMGRYKKNSTNNCASIIGNNGYITFTDYVNSVAMAIYRGYGANGTTVSFSDAFANGNTDNDRCIPYQIYGIKLHHTVEIKAIAPEVSTLASKCMMSDGETSVESEINKYNSLIDNPLAHNGIYTGRNLGTISSASDWAAFRAKYGIADKSYKGLYLGDYVKVNDGTYNADWMVAGFNTETNKGSTNIPGECVSMIPRVGNGCGTSYMNSTNTTAGGYKSSYMHTTKLPDVATKLTTIFGSNLVTRDILVSNTVTNGYASGWEWISCKCSLMTSVQVYGSLLFENTGGTYFAGYNIGEGCEKLPVFNFINPVQFSRSNFWLRGVHSASLFCLVSGYGAASHDSASAAYGVRPLICLS